MIYHGTVVCLNCECEYRSSEDGSEIGVIVRVMFQNDTRIIEHRHADIWICPGCGHRILKGWSDGFGRHYDGPAFREAIAEWEREKKRGRAFTIWKKRHPSKGEK